MPMLDTFLAILNARATGRIDPLKTAAAVGQIAGSIDVYLSDRGKQLLTHLLLPWANQVAMQAVNKWVLPTHLPPSCQMDANGRACGELAVGGCHICGRPICLTHALVATDATIVCWACMRLAGKHAKPWKPAASDAGTNSDKWAYELLGVEPGCTKAQVKKAFRERIARFHPDKLPADADPKANADLVRLLKLAYDTISAACEE